MLSISNSLLAMTALFNAGIAVIILRQGKWKNPINLFFGIFLSALSVWALALIGFQTAVSDYRAIGFGKLAYASALVIGMSFYLFSIAFPEGKKPKLMTMLIVCGLTFLYIAGLFCPTFLIREIHVHSYGREVFLGIPEYFVFGALFCFFYIGGLIRTWLKYAHSRGLSSNQLLIIAASVSITGIGGMYYNLILASPFLHDFKYLWTGPLFTTSIAVMIMYAVFRLHLFNAKVVVTEFLVALLWISTFLRTLVAVDVQDRFFDGLLFLLTLVLGTLLIRSVYWEVHSRETIEKQEKELEKVNRGLAEANRRQEELIHFISHEVKGYLAKSQTAFAAIVDGGYGPVAPALKKMSTMALGEMRTGVETVLEILSASSFKKGVVTYAMQPADLREVVAAEFDALRAAAEEKHLAYELVVEPGDYHTRCDPVQVGKHVVRNLIENAIKYTPEGSVRVLLQRRGESIVCTIKDSGIGIVPEDKARLFTEGGRGKDSLKINPHSTGYGLFIAKSIVSAHKGSLRVESAGAGKGSAFILELPVLV